MAICVVQGEGRIERLNQAFLDLLPGGRESEDVIENKEGVTEESKRQKQTDRQRGTEENKAR